MLLASSVSTASEFWVDAFRCAILQSITSCQWQSVESPRTDYYLHTFSSFLYHTAHLQLFPITPSLKHKLQNTMTYCCFLGYFTNHRGYRYWELATKCIIVSHHVQFNEQVSFRGSDMLGLINQGAYNDSFWPSPTYLVADTCSTSHAVSNHIANIKACTEYHLNLHSPSINGSFNFNSRWSI